MALPGGGACDIASNAVLRWCGGRLVSSWLCCCGVTPFGDARPRASIAARSLMVQKVPTHLWVGRRRLELHMVWGCSEWWLGVC